MMASVLHRVRQYGDQSIVWLVSSLLMSEEWITWMAMTWNWCHTWIWLQDQIENVSLVGWLHINITQNVTQNKTDCKTREREKEAKKREKVKERSWAYVMSRSCSSLGLGGTVWLDLCGSFTQLPSQVSVCQNNGCLARNRPPHSTHSFTLWVSHSLSLSLSDCVLRVTWL